MTETRTVKIPKGNFCLVFPMKPCIFAVYSKRSDAYNCRLYNRFLSGRKAPMKCDECLAGGKKDE